MNGFTNGIEIPAYGVIVNVFTNTILIMIVFTYGRVYIRRAIPFLV